MSSDFCRVMCEKKFEKNRKKVVLKFGGLK